MKNWIVFSGGLEDKIFDPLLSGIEYKTKEMRYVMYKGTYGKFSTTEILDGFRKGAVIGFARMLWDAFYGLVWITHPGEWMKWKGV